MMRPGHWLLLTAALAAGITGGALWPPPPPPDVGPDTSDWKLPEAATLVRHTAQDLIDVNRSLRWDGARTQEPEQEPTSIWRLAGIVREPDAAVLIITQERAQEAQRFVPGDVLPDGSVLIAIDGDRVQNQRGACTSTWQLFLSQPVAQSNGCTAAPDEDTDATFQPGNPP